LISIRHHPPLESGKEGARKRFELQPPPDPEGEFLKEPRELSILRMGKRAGRLPGQKVLVEEKVIASLKKDEGEEVERDPAPVKRHSMQIPHASFC
jgi:hypothetical protein